jgi:hypothetical protein
MTLDLSTLKPGDKVRLRNGEIRTVLKVDKNDRFLPVQISNGRGAVWYYQGGGYYEGEDCPDALDIVDIDPELEPMNESTPANLPFKVYSKAGEGVVMIEYEGKDFTPADAWPEPITDRKPTEEDADSHGDVQWLDCDGALWVRYSWLDENNFKGWARTSDWKPKPPSKKQQALAAFDKLLEHCTDNTGEAIIREVLEARE